MVLIDSMKLLCGAEETVDSELCLGSGTAIAYVAPQRYIHALSSGEEGGSSCLSALPQHPRRKMSAINGGGGMDKEDRWEGVLDFCLAIDQAVEVDHETHMFENKRVLEFGFCTGLPSAFAFRHGAKSLCMYCWDETKLDTIVKPTLRRNNVSRSVCKFDGGDYKNFKRTTSQKFDVILAPELISIDEGEFESLHDLLEGALSQDGIILFSARPHYTASDCTGNLPTFLDLLKTKGKFDAHIRWTSPKSDIAPRKLVQMTRSIR